MAGSQVLGRLGRVPEVVPESSKYVRKRDSAGRRNNQRQAVHPVSEAFDDSERVIGAQDWLSALAARATLRQGSLSRVQSTFFTKTVPAVVMQ